jgi:hypothetical protein
MRWRIPLLIALVTLVAVSCDQQLAEPESADGASVPSLKVENNVYYMVLERSEYFPPVEDCLGETAQMYGVDAIWVREMTTASGNFQCYWKPDYETYPPPTLELTPSGRVYTRVKAEYAGTCTFHDLDVPWGKKNEQWHEWYVSDGGDKLRLDYKAHIALDKEGNLTFQVWEWSCR